MKILSTLVLSDAFLAVILKLIFWDCEEESEMNSVWK